MNSPGKRAKVEVVIVNWQRSQDTIQCIRSIRRSESVDIHIVVIDNGSRDDSVEKISEAFPGISIISLTENLGFTGGYNSGIENALKGNASHIFLLNNDTIIEERTIKQLIDSNWDVAVPKITFYDEPEIIWAAGAKWRSFPPTIKMIGYKKKDSPAFANAYPLEYATGCALMVKKEVLAEIKGFDPQYFNYMEDYDFSYQIRDSGFSMGYVPEAIVKHKVSRSLGSSSPQRWHYMGRNTVLFYRKDDRFPTYTLWCALGWIILRELIQGNSSILPSFWGGVKEGLKITSGNWN